ncbi:MAG: family 10 glycosylhydrolase [Bacteroidaceae bacterium]|nr:family 10 glycosylhydrolase [Bacteroidaceae bacterium]
MSAPPAPKHEIRAIWLTTIGGLDWPKTLAKDEESRQMQKEELCQILDQLQACHINTVVLQTRIRGSVIYPSDIEPWDICLTGQFDRNPGYDPLAFAIEETHKRGMELHAWLVTVPAFKIVNAKKMGKRSLFKTHPELLRKHGEQYYLDPGLPGSSDYLTAICQEIVSNYDIDGIHFDYIRYPEHADSFSDAASFKKYGRGQNKRDWRLDNITGMVRQAYEAIKELKPWVRVSCSPVGKYKDLSRYSAKGWSAYGAVYQDAQLWLKEGIMDMLLPMMYFQGDHFYPFAADWQENCYGRPVAPGLGIYFLSPKEKDWDLGVIQRELCYLRQMGLNGQAYFRSQFLTDNTKGIYDYLQKDFYPYPALLPPMTWESSSRPDVPLLVKRERRNGVNEYLEWVPKEGCRYVIYASREHPVDISNPANIVRVTCDNSYTYSLLGAYYHNYHLAVTALDRYGNESLPLEL